MFWLFNFQGSWSTVTFFFSRWQLAHVGKVEISGEISFKIGFSLLSSLNRTAVLTVSGPQWTLGPLWLSSIWACSAVSALALAWLCLLPGLLHTALHTSLPIALLHDITQHASDQCWSIYCFICTLCAGCIPEWLVWHSRAGNLWLCCCWSNCLCILLYPKKTKQTSNSVNNLNGCGVSIVNGVISMVAILTISTLSLNSGQALKH